MKNTFQRFATRVAVVITCAAFLYNARVASAGLLGTAVNFAVVAGQTVTNTGNTVINGDLGVFPGSAYTGSSTVTQTGTVYIANGVSQTAENDITNAYTYFAALPANINLSGTDLGTLTLGSGVYQFTSDALLTGTLTLDAQNNPNALFVFQIGSKLTTAPNASVNVIHGNSGTGVYFQVGSSATLGSATSFAGNILALSSISLNTGATDCGRALARNGQVSLQANTISNSCGVAADFGSAAFSGNPSTPAPAFTPEPGTVPLLGMGLLGLSLGMRKWRKA